MICPDFIGHWHTCDSSVSVSQVHITQYADSVASHLAKILDSDRHSDVISSAKYVPSRTVHDQVKGEKSVRAEQHEKLMEGGGGGKMQTGKVERVSLSSTSIDSFFMSLRTQTGDSKCCPSVSERDGWISI